MFTKPKSKGSLNSLKLTWPLSDSEGLFGPFWVQWRGQAVFWEFSFIFIGCRNALFIRRLPKLCPIFLIASLCFPDQHISKEPTIYWLRLDHFLGVQKCVLERKGRNCQSMTYLRAVQTHNFLTQICEIFCVYKVTSMDEKPRFFPLLWNWNINIFPSQGANVGRGGGPEDLKSSQRCC